MRPMARTLFEKLWDNHVVSEESGRALLYIDLHLIHEVTTPQAFDGLRLAGRKVRRPDRTFATMDHNVPTDGGPATDPLAKAQLDALARAYVNAAGAVAVDPTARTVRVTQIFEWFREDFAGAGGTVEWLRAFAGTPLRARLNAACGAGAGACAVTYRPYDWALNAAP